MEIWNEPGATLNDPGATFISSNTVPLINTRFLFNIYLFMYLLYFTVPGLPKYIFFFQLLGRHLLLKIMYHKPGNGPEVDNYDLSLNRKLKFRNKKHKQCTNSAKNNYIK